MMAAPRLVQVMKVVRICVLANTSSMSTAVGAWSWCPDQALCPRQMSVCRNRMPASPSSLLMRSVWSFRARVSSLQRCTACKVMWADNRQLGWASAGSPSMFGSCQGSPSSRTAGSLPAASHISFRRPKCSALSCRASSTMTRSYARRMGSASHVSQHIRCACEEMEDMRKQFERVLGVRLSDKARKLSRAHMPGATVGFLDDSVTVSRSSCCTTVRKRAGTRKRQTGELNNTREATDNASAAVPAPATKAWRCKHKQKRPLPERSWVGVIATA